MYLLKKEDKTVTIDKSGENWSYKKEFGTNIIENFEINDNKLNSLLVELENFGYKLIENVKVLPTIMTDKFRVKYWMVNGKYHREDGPAIEYVDHKDWYKNGFRHREDGPAIEFNNGTQHWYKKGLLHRADGPAVIACDGSTHWYFNGTLHRDNGPAIELANKTKYWFKNGDLHREDGPAIEYANGDKDWYLEYSFLTEEEFNNRNI